MFSETAEIQPPTPFPKQLETYKEIYLSLNRAQRQAMLISEKGAEPGQSQSEQSNRVFGEIADLVIAELERGSADERLATLSLVRRALCTSREAHYPFIDPFHVFSNAVMNNLTDQVVLKLLEKAQSPQPPSSA